MLKTIEDREVRQRNAYCNRTDGISESTIEECWDSSS